MRDIKVGLVQMTAVIGRIELNLGIHRKFVEKAAQQNAELVCFPELSISGLWEHPGRWNISQPVPGGEAIDYLVQLCSQYGVFISAGIAEKAGQAIYNTQVIVGPKGYVGKQRKLHRSGDEYYFYRGGYDIEIIDIAGIKIGIVICFDNMFPEVQRCLAVKGAELVLMPHAARCSNKWPISVVTKKAVLAEQDLLIEKIFASRCYDNNQYGLYCNQRGHAGTNANFIGGLAVLGPNGNVVAHKTDTVKNGLLVVTLSANELIRRRKRPCSTLLVRRPEVYSDLTILT